MSERKLPILCLDFDGVVHDYKRGWQDGAIYGEVTDGFRRWAERARAYFTLIIHTSRARTEDGAEEVMDWLKKRDLDWIEVTTVKPPAFITIDDRALTFTGSWAEFDPLKLRAFRPWNVGPME